MERWRFYSETLARGKGAWTDEQIAKDVGAVLMRLCTAIPSLARVEYFELVHEINLEDGELHVVVFLQARPQLSLFTTSTPTRRGRGVVKSPAIKELRELRDSIRAAQRGMDGLAPRLRKFDEATLSEWAKDEKDLAKIVRNLRGRSFAVSLPEGEETLCIPALPRHVVDENVTRLRAKVEQLNDKRATCSGVRFESGHDQKSAPIHNEAFFLFPADGKKLIASERAAFASAWEAKADIVVEGHLIRCAWSGKLLGLGIRGIG